MIITTMALAMSSSSSSAKVVSGSGFPRSISLSEHRVSQIRAFRLLDQPHVASTAVRLSQRRSSVKPVKSNGSTEQNPSDHTGSGTAKNDDERAMTKVDQQVCGKQLKLPIFMGEDPDGWVYQIERYFKLYKISLDEDKLNYASLAMEGEALAWYRWEEGRKKWTTWAVAKELLLKRFRSTKGGTLLEQFLAIRQESTVREYRQLFELYAAPLKTENIEISEPVLESQFVNGLKPDIREELRLMEPKLKGLEEKMEMAQRIEDKNNALRIRTSNGRIIP